MMRLPVYIARSWPLAPIAWLVAMVVQYHRMGSPRLRTGLVAAVIVWLIPVAIVAFLRLIAPRFPSDRRSLVIVWILGLTILVIASVDAWFAL